MMHYDSDFHRMRQRERMAEMRAEYQRVQRHGQSPASARMRRYAASTWSHMRHPIARRAPAFRA
jgi:hypothetical protein